MLRRDFRQTWNSCAPSAGQKEECLKEILEQRTKDTEIRGFQWRPKGQFAPWLLILLLIAALIVSAYYVADLYGVVDNVSDWVNSVLPNGEETDASTEPSTSEVTQSRPETNDISYGPLVAKYVQAIEEDWDMIRLQEEDISYLVMFLDRPEDLSYVIEDIDGNDVQEMIITDGNVIVDLYTISDGAYFHILSGAERDSFTLTANNEIVNVSSGGAGYTLYRMYLYYGTNLIPMEMIVCDASRDPSAPWFRGIDHPEDVTPISEAEAREIIAMYPSVPIRGTAVTMFD